MLAVVHIPNAAALADRIITLRKTIQLAAQPWNHILAPRDVYTAVAHTQQTT